MVRRDIIKINKNKKSIINYILNTEEIKHTKMNSKLFI
jgi:hypothetical protein